jgi:adenosine deaminase
MVQWQYPQESEPVRWNATAWRRAVIEMPKAHLHLHLGGSCPASVWRRLGQPNPPKRTDVVARGFELFEQQHRSLRQTIASQLSIDLLVQEVAAQAHSEGVLWVELSIDPVGWDPRWVTPERVAGAIAQARRYYPVGFGVIALYSRTRGADDDRVLEWAIQMASLGVPAAVGLAGDELAAELRLFSQRAAAVHRAGLPWVPHSGELDGQLAELRLALSHQWVSRIAHGWVAAQDTSCMAQLIQHRVCLDLAPGSNLRLGVRKLGNHPVGKLAAAGVPISISSDNPLMVGHDLVTELQLAGRFMGLGPEGVAWAGLCSLRHSLAPALITRRWEGMWADWARKWGLGHLPQEWRD